MMVDDMLCHIVELYDAKCGRNGRLSQNTMPIDLIVRAFYPNPKSAGRWIIQITNRNHLSRHLLRWTSQCSSFWVPLCFEGELWTMHWKNNARYTVGLSTGCRNCHLRAP